MLMTEKENPDSGQCHMDVVESGLIADDVKFYHIQTILLNEHCAEAGNLWLCLQENCRSRPEAEAQLGTPGNREEGGFLSAVPDAKVVHVPAAGTG